MIIFISDQSLDYYLFIKDILQKFTIALPLSWEIQINAKN